MYIPGRSSFAYMYIPGRSFPKTAYSGIKMHLLISQLQSNKNKNKKIIITLWIFRRKFIHTLTMIEIDNQKSKFPRVREFFNLIVFLWKTVLRFERNTLRRRGRNACEAACTRAKIHDNARETRGIRLDVKVGRGRRMCESTAK